VAAQDDDPGSALNFVRRLLALRAERDVLQAGQQHSLDAAPGVFCFLRVLGSERMLVALNFTSQPVPTGLAGDAEIELSTDPERTLGAVDLGSLTVGPDEGLLFTVADLPARA
jgi:glycosidase